MKNSTRAGIILFAACFMVTRCALVKLKKDLGQGQASTVLVGRVSTEFSGNGPIVVAAYAMNQGEREVEHYSVLHEHGEFELMVRKGNYYIFAYWDKNSNLIYDEGEPAGQYGDPNIVAAPDGGVVPEINIAIPEIAQHINVLPGFEIPSDQTHKLYSRQAGAIQCNYRWLWSRKGHGCPTVRRLPPTAFFIQLSIGAGKTSAHTRASARWQKT